ncbi:MAG: response regulator [Planctomycetota bacterium]
MSTKPSNDAERILIVDDEQAVCRFLSGSLAKEGYLCKTAERASSVLRMMVEFNPALVIADVRMPGLSGLQLLDLVRQYFPATSVVIMTGYGTMEDAAGVIKRGASDFVLKPLGLPKIKTVVRKVLDDRRAWLDRQDDALRRMAEATPVEADPAVSPADLQVVVDAWPRLSNAVKAGILAVVKAANVE